MYSKFWYLIIVGWVSFVSSNGALCQEAAAIARSFHQANAASIVEDFITFLRIPNDAINLEDMMRNALFIEDYIEQRGFKSEIILAGGAPYIFAERKGSSESKTILIYAHFDGQPVVPEQWSSPPYEPTFWTALPNEPGAQIISTNQPKINPEWRLVARSAGDDKAPVIALMSAIDALYNSGVMPDITIKLFLDGEEERGSPTLNTVLGRLSKKMDTDLMLFCDGPMHQSGRRQIVLGVRGSMTIDLKTFGPNRPLHSGHYGNWAPNPSETLMRVLLSLKNDSGEVILEGFNENVTPISSSEIAAINQIPAIEADLKRDLGLGANELLGERLEHAIMRPAIVVKGFDGGGVGARARNVIEPSAEASLNVRLVPDQQPHEVERLLEEHFKKIGMNVSAYPPSSNQPREKHLQMVVRRGGYRAFRTDINSEMVKKIKNILDRLDDEQTLITPTMGGSLPIYLFEDALKAPIMILPIANFDNNQHGRDENLRLKNLFDAIEMYAEVLVGISGNYSTRLGVDEETNKSGN